MDIGAKLVVGLIGQVIFWIALFTALAMLKRYVSFGVSVAFAEILSKSPDEMQHKIAKWFGNGQEIVDVIKDMRERE